MSMRIVFLSAGGISHASRRMGTSLVLSSSRFTNAAFSSSLTHLLPTLLFESTMINAVHDFKPSLKILSTKLSPGSISQLSTHASTPLHRGRRAKSSTKRSLSA
jgi:hypothetical protein